MIIVAGLTRSGLSVTMQMLWAGGYPCLGRWPAFEQYAVGRVPWHLLPDRVAVKLVDAQLSKAKASLEKRFGATVDVLAWPFGIYDDELEKDAAKAGYVVAFSIDRRHASKSEKMMAQPRYLMVNGDGTKNFEAIVSGRAQEKGHKTY